MKKLTRFTNKLFDRDYSTAAKMLVTLVVCAGFFVAEPAMAQAWATKIKSVADQGVSGLKIIGSAVALCCLLWSAYQIIWGGKRLQDMVGWFIGAILCFAADDIVALFFK